MLTNRKKLKNRKKKIKIIVGTTLFIIFSCAILGYFLWTLFLSKAHYISPLTLVLSSDSSIETEKNIESLRNRLKQEKIDFLSVSLLASDYIIRLKDYREIVLSSQKDLNVQISSLQFIILRLTMEGRQFQRLDLRYDKPIIVFK